MPWPRPPAAACLFAALAGGGCAPGSDQPFVAGPLARHAAAVAAANHVPRDLLLAIARVEGGLLLPARRVVREDDEVPVGGMLELRHGRFNSLARGAALLAVDETALRQDTDLGTLAGARVLAELGVATAAREGDLGSWRRAVELLSGLPESRFRDEYLRDVFTTLRDGGLFPARDSEVVFIAPHPEIGDAAIGVLRQELGGPPPDFPGAIWFNTDCNNKCTAGRPDGNGAVDKIVIHDTEGGWAGSVATLQFDGGKSVHYIIDADGSRVGQFIHETETTWHAGNWFWNKRSIGIEHVGFVADPNGYQSALYDKSVQLVKNIRSRWKVPLDRQHIVGHYQIPNGDKIAQDSPACPDHIAKCETNTSYGGAAHHTDPGLNWQWCQYMQKLGGTCTCNDAWPLWNCTTDKTQAVRCVNGKVEIDDCKPCESKPNGVDDVCHMAPPPPDMARPPAPRDLATPAPADQTTPPADLVAAPSRDLAPPPSGDLGGSRDGGATDGLPIGLGDGGEAELGQTVVTGGCRCSTTRGRTGAPSLLLLGALALALWLVRQRPTPPGA